MARNGSHGLRQITAKAYAKILKYGLKRKEPITRAIAAELGGWNKSTYHHLRKMTAAGLLEYKGYNQWIVNKRALQPSGEMKPKFERQLSSP